MERRGTESVVLNFNARRMLFNSTRQVDWFPHISNGALIGISRAERRMCADREYELTSPFIVEITHILEK